MRVVKIGVAVAVFFAAAAVGAQGWEKGLSGTPFSAEYVISAGGQPMQGMPPIKVATSERAVRVDFGSHVAIVQLRPGAAQVSTLMPAEKTYTTESLPYDSEDLEAYLFMLPPPGGYEAACEEGGIVCEKVGVEEIAGRQADHWRVQDPSEGTTESWFDSELRILLRATDGEGNGMQASNISTAESPASLFEVPRDYKLSGGEGW